MVHEVQQTRWDRLVRRVSGSIGPGSRVSETLSELFPTLNVEDLPLELLALGGTHLAVGSSNRAAVAAVFQVSELFNPVDSGSLITLMYLQANSSDTSLVMGLTDGAFTTNNPTTVGFADGRLFGVATPVGQVRDETAGAAGVVNWRLFGNQFLDNIFAPPKGIAVLSPGTGWSVSTTVVNKSLEVGYVWMERPAEQSELSL
ncbi:MAG: hypothetical protein V3S55_01305 [Nitrospiraceae bacterium]